MLDRIRVIHSEGDSLYREFDIPDEETSEETPAENKEDTKVVEIDEQPSVEQTEQGVADTTESSTKLSWRDKIKAKMAENADNYDNLDSVLGKKKND